MRLRETTVVVLRRLAGGEGLALLHIGPVDSDSMPPARMVRLMPAAICPRATAIAERLDAHWRFDGQPGT